MRKPIYTALFLLFSLFSLDANADAQITSGTTDILQNPFVAIGRNESTNSVSGYVEALRVSPQRADECKFLFKGELKNNQADNVLVVGATKSYLGREDIGSFSRASLRKSGNTITILINKKDAPDDCDWILGFLGDPAIKESSEKYEISFAISEIGSWREVTVIRTGRAYFYDYPNVKSRRKSFVVRGDVIYVYDQDKDWLNVKYQHGKQETRGWIKRSDTLQIPKQP